MSRKRLTKLKREVEGMRRRLGSIRSAELVTLAGKTGRKSVNRGKEPTYEHPDLPWPPLTIPKHPGTLAKGTAYNILNSIEADLDRLEENLDQLDDEQEQTDDDGEI